MAQAYRQGPFSLLPKTVYSLIPRLRRSTNTASIPTLSIILIPCALNRNRTNRFSLGTQIRFDCIFGSQVRRVLLFACDTRLPKRVLIPVTGHSIANSPKLHPTTSVRPSLQTPQKRDQRRPIPLRQPLKSLPRPFCASAVSPTGNLCCVLYFSYRPKQSHPGPCARVTLAFRLPSTFKLRFDRSSTFASGSIALSVTNPPNVTNTASVSKGVRRSPRVP